MKEDEKDQRKYPRLGTIWDVDYRVLTSEEFESNPLQSFTVNISGGGICFEAREEIKPGTILTLEMKSPIFPSAILALAKTVWCRKNTEKGKYEVGVEFWWTGWKDKNAQEAVAEYISKHIH
ncbi:MAG: PilZ domain-containing protein [Candidatus Aminicenantes bacterium]|nr:PilZ domain-containing protein [Candidatus Aminicenantes bacterium]